MKFKVTAIKGKDLKPGDLFSNVGELYWSEKNINLHISIGEKVYIRTDTPLPKDQLETNLYKIEVAK